MRHCVPTEVLQLRLTKLELHKLWKMIDINGGGTINFNEFIAGVNSDCLIVSLSHCLIV